MRPRRQPHDLALRKVMGEIVHVEVAQRLEHRGLDLAALAGRLALVERGQHDERSIEACHRVVMKVPMSSTRTPLSGLATSPFSLSVVVSSLSVRGELVEPRLRPVLGPSTSSVRTEPGLDDLDPATACAR